MKKISSIILGALILLGGIASYMLLTNDSPNTSLKQNQVKSSKEKERVLSSEGPIRLAKQNIIYTVQTNAVLKRLYPTIDEFNKDPEIDAIIKGRVTRVDYSYLDGIARSILTVNVLQSFKGNVPKTIKAYEDGGYVRLKDVMERFKDKNFETTYTPEQIENGIVDFKFENAPHAKPGQQVMLYLWRNKPPLPTDTFMIESSVYGRFTLNKNNGNYERPKEENSLNNFEASIPEAVMEKKLSDIK